MPTTSPRNPIALAAIAFGLIASYLLAPLLPHWTGWENGPVENAQAALLFWGGVSALHCAAQSEAGRPRAFWWMVAPIWFVMVGRELSWGAALLTPLDFSAQTGPTFSSTQQLAYKPAVAPVVGMLAAFSLAVFVRTRQYRTLQSLWQRRALPLAEIGLFAAALLLSTAAEGHMGLSIPWTEEWALQNLEELAELCAYAALFCAQWRVRACLRSCEGPQTGA